MAGHALVERHRLELEAPPRGRVVGVDEEGAAARAVGGRREVERLGADLGALHRARRLRDHLEPVAHRGLGPGQRDLGLLDHLVAVLEVERRGRSASPRRSSRGRRCRRPRARARGTRRPSLATWARPMSWISCAVFVGGREVAQRRGRRRRRRRAARTARTRSSGRAWRQRVAQGVAVAPRARAARTARPRRAGRRVARRRRRPRGAARPRPRRVVGEGSASASSIWLDGLARPRTRGTPSPSATPSRVRSASCRKWAPTASSLAGIASATVWSGTASRPISRAQGALRDRARSRRCDSPGACRAGRRGRAAELMITPRVSTSSGSSGSVGRAPRPAVAKSRRVAAYRSASSREACS